ncbi:ribosomal L7Ae/L30e/S12e/Gadd45 family protein [Eubacteriales bacterium OttesenSCG-928-K08]|nr:ribosomal L7Ae/L30e/S12e/Gadd45 family protein [Eubacteriales bacterium OttesenSCG-928-K08]
MLEDIGPNIVIGTKQALKAMQAGALEYIYVAEDVEPYLKNKLITAGQEFGVQIRPAPSMKELGAQCGIDVGAACVGVPKK